MLKIVYVTAFVLMCASSFAQHSITGEIVDAKTNQPLKGASVVVEETSDVTITDDAGRFTFLNLKPGTYTVEATFVGYGSYRHTTYVEGDVNLFISMTQVAIMPDAVVITATRATDKTPTTFTTVDRKSIQKQNFGQDLPFLINWTPSVVTTSDAGTGIGYTGIRIRGSDATRINVTINGIPYNDSESSGTFWVDIPDIASSSQSIQIQRGVGTSTNGAAAFGASINLQTNERRNEAYGEIINAVGSFDTRRHTFNFGSGLLNNHWIVEGRVSKIKSNGFIDRAFADLSSYYFSAGYYDENTILKAITFGGKERTYQSWYGVPESRLNNDDEAMDITAMNEGWNEIQTANLKNSNSRTFNPYLYENQVDDYQQDHFQLHFSQKINRAVVLNTALHYTPGKGFYEEYRYNDDLENYALPPVAIGDSTVTSTDLIRRRWLDNNFYGFTASATYNKTDWNIIFGGGWNRYNGDHFGEIIWAQVSPVPYGYQYYMNNGDKRDFNVYGKANWQATENLNFFLDLQYRGLRYEALGIESKQNSIRVNETFNFFNPKAGITYSLSDNQQLYGSFAVANREPVRDDFIDNPGNHPKSEKLYNYEWGYRITSDKLVFNANYYLMSYRDQLVLTGKLNDVGASVRTNVDKSYRTGIELESAWKVSRQLQWNINLTLSRNKIDVFKEVLYDYGVNFDEYNEVIRTYKNTDISFSPSAIAASQLSYAFMGAEISLLSKFVGRQYLDNTSNKRRRLDPYAVNDVRLTYTWKPKFIQEIGFSFLVNNILAEAYESNGYTWGYLGGGEEYRENYYYPQAARNFLGMITIKF